jgi:hypothetical protein
MSAYPGGGARKVTAGAENGDPIALWKYHRLLDRQTQYPETMWLKTTNGADTLHRVEQAYRPALS